VDPCIFKGNLLKEPTTEVLVTGGCAGANTFEVILNSNFVKSVFLNKSKFKLISEGVIKCGITI
jgi:hypothetical protein